MARGEYHAVVNIWTANSNNEVLLTLRHPDKKDYPNFWENTRGSVIAGETSRAGAVRELFEETGIVAEENELVLLDTAKEKNMFIDVYIVRKDIRICDMTMQDGETLEAKWVSLGILDEMIKSEMVAFPVAERLKRLRKKFEDFIFKK